MREQEDIADQAARLRALDPTTSFIVQAPAGSGKTALLAQRFLVLLASVDAPEEIVAITFTRKAAAEMRQRIVQALERAENHRPPESAHERQTWELAQQALARDKKQSWHLLAYPSRLRIQTIDSLCAALARQMPILSRFGSVPAIAENPETLYLKAAINTITELESVGESSEAIAHLARHLDNRLDKLQSLVVMMLSKRDQWLRHLADPKHPRLERRNLEAGMAALITDALGELARCVPETCEGELIVLSRFAIAYLEEKDIPIAACVDLQRLPGEKISDRRKWEGITALLLTKEGAWRKQVTKNEGFPAKTSGKNKGEKALFSEMKQRMAALLASLQEEEVFREHLALVQALPPHQYSDAEWKTLEASVKVLLLAAAHLELVFSEQGQVDFSALAHAAIQALGEPEAPTDLALALDYRIRHLLVDEFQDASHSQHNLLESLTAGWQLEDGHSLFVVGDPMQSIYRFREAEVGLFLAAGAQGIAQVPLEFLRLSVNFRSQQGIVDWINQSFSAILPSHDSIPSGAVSYATSSAFHPPLKADAVRIHPSLERDDIAEALQVVVIVQQAKILDPDGTIAILVRGRTHLGQIITQLQKEKLQFQAVEIERLAHRPLIQDLLALTRALNHLADRIAWLSVLRAPYCGLTLADLHVLAEDDSGRTLIEKLHQKECIECLSKEGRRRIARVLPILDTALSENCRCPLRTHIEGLWIALGGPACVVDETDLEEAEVYFQLLERLRNTGETSDMHELSKQLDQLFALPDLEADESLQLMTIHKAKGLEFDTVIIPGLGRTPGEDHEKLLHCLELSSQSGHRNLLLAPINAQGEDKNPMATYLKRLDHAKGHFEDGRLLYVAATRAKKHLHLLAHIGIQDGGDELELRTPPQNALLARLWPVVKNDFQALLTKRNFEVPLTRDSIEPSGHPSARTRLALDWSLPTPPAAVQVTATSVEHVASEQVEFDWAGETARHLGTVVHRLLQHIGEVGVDHFDSEPVSHFESIARQMLVNLGVPTHHLQASIKKVRAAIQTTLKDKRGRWILNSRHKKASCELALSGLQNGSIDHIVIDRTFVDAQDTRWIIDYKIGTHTGGDIEEFLDREQTRYRQQVDRYASILSKIEERSIRLGLYFPLLGGWREWAF